jgi:uncharacterized protein YbcI
MAQQAERPTGGALAAAISSMMVQLLLQYTGRGPTTARTSVGRDHVLILLEDALTKGERTLATNGHAEDVLAMRKQYQRVMRAEASDNVEELTGRKVIAFLSDNHVDPDIGVEVFVLEPCRDPVEPSQSTTAEPHE